MNDSTIRTLTRKILLGLALFFVLGNAQARNYIFVNGATNSWADVRNWYFLQPDQTLKPANAIPLNSDSIELYTESNINLTGFGHQSTIIMEAGSAIVGGSCVVDTLSVTQGVISGGASVTLTYKMLIARNAFVNTSYGPNGLHLMDAGTTFTANSSSTTVVNSGAISMSGGATFINQGVISLLSGSEIYGAADQAGGSAFRNYGTVACSGMTAMLGVNLGGGASTLNLDNPGTIEVDSGDLSVSSVFWSTSSGQSTIVTTSAPATATLYLNVNPGETMTVKGPGTVLIQGLTLNGTINCGIVDPTTGLLDPGAIELDGLLNFNNGTYGPSYVYGSGTLHILGQGAIGSALISTMGGVTIEPGGGTNIIIDSGATWSIAGQILNGTQLTPLAEIGQNATVTNFGAITLNNGSLFLDGDPANSGAVLNNEPTGLIDLQSNSNISGSPSMGGPLATGLINNFGVLRKSPGTGASQVGGTVNNSGTVSVQGSQLDFGGFVQSSAGTLSVSIESDTSYGRVQFAASSSNPVTFGGSLVLDLAPGYIPADYTAFPIVTYASALVPYFSGNFNSTPEHFALVNVEEGSGQSAVEAIYTNAPADQSPLDGYYLSGGFFYLSTFGYYNEAYYPFVYHSELGFMFFDVPSFVSNDIYIYTFDANLGFLYTTPSLLPYFYSFNKGGILYYFPNTQSFFNFKTGQFEKHGIGLP